MDINPQEYYEGLNPQQHKAVFNDYQYLCLLAIPGSGKTHALIGKIIHLIESEQVYSHEITAITFTNKAAKELKERVNKYVGEVEGESITIGTFHSLCMRILIKNGYKVGLEKFSIMNDYTSKKKMKKIAKRYFSEDDKIDIRRIKGMISNWKKSLISPKKAFSETNSNYSKTVARVYNDYYKECYKENNLDFDDLIVKTVILLKRYPSIRKQITRDIKFLLVDESQDTNDIQFKLIKLLLRKDTKLFMVADDDQSIYGFRGAEPKYILNFKKLFKGGQLLKLEQNYRSTKNIINAANHVIANNKNRQRKNAFTENETGEKILVKECETPYEEADYVVNEVKSLVEMNGYDYKDIAILYRINSQSRKLEDRFNRERIPYHIIGSTSFYDRMEIKDIMAYLKLLVNPKDKESFERIMGLQGGIGKKSVERLVDFGSENNLNYIGVINKYNKKSRIIKNMQKMKNLIAEVKAIKTDHDDNPKMILERIVETTGYLNYLESKFESDFETREKNVAELFNIAQAYLDNNTKEFRSLQDFVNQLSLSSTETDEEPNTLKMLTIHSAKGLEFPIVFIVGVEEKMIPFALCMENEDQIEEERRLFYVAMTRAEKKLYLSHSMVQYNFKGMEVDAMPSRYLTNIPGKYTKVYDKKNEFDDFNVGAEETAFAI